MRGHGGDTAGVGSGSVRDDGRADRGPLISGDGTARASQKRSVFQILFDLPQRLEAGIDRDEPVRTPVPVRKPFEPLEEELVPLLFLRSSP